MGLSVFINFSLPLPTTSARDDLDKEVRDTDWDKSAGMDSYAFTAGQRAAFANAFSRVAEEVSL